MVVFPVPGGPASSSPLGGSTPKRWVDSGSSITAWSCCRPSLSGAGRPNPGPVLDGGPVFTTVPFHGGQQVLRTHLQVRAGLLGLPEHLEGGAVDDPVDWTPASCPPSGGRPRRVVIGGGRTVLELGQQDAATGLGVGKVDAHVAGRSARGG
jgi:hypothetical protein